MATSNTFEAIKPILKDNYASKIEMPKLKGAEKFKRLKKILSNK